MTEYSIFKSSLLGKIEIPPSKSHTLRAILFGALAKGKTRITNFLESPDTQAMINACEALGAKIEKLSSTTLQICGVDGMIKEAENVIDAGNSGIVLRFIAAACALSNKHSIITGDDSIRNNRPMEPLLKGLSQFGAFAVSSKGNGRAPIIIKGPLKSGITIVDGEDSQPISALLIAAAFSEGTFEIHVEKPGERPWIDMTLHWFDHLGISYESRNYEWYRISGSQKINGFDFKVPGDWSSAAFPLVAALITRSELIIENLDFNDVQGDKKLITLLKKMGATIEVSRNYIHVRQNSDLHGCELDINDCIDSIAVCAVIGCFAKGTTQITNAGIARMKESDRISCLTTELRKMGAKIKEKSDGIEIQFSPLCGTFVNSHHDHRLAMALCIAGLGAEGKTTVINTSCINKTFPLFIQKFKSLGANVSY